MEVEMLRILAAAALAVLAMIGPAAAEDPPTLTIYTYDSFVSEWGPGPAIQPLFEASCACRIEWVGLEDGAALLSRLKLEGQGTKADVMLGLDNNLTAEARATGLFGDHGIAFPVLSLPVIWSDPNFVPFDFGYFAFVYDSNALPKPPASLADLVAVGKDEPKIIVMDPRTSTPGLGLLLWMKAVYGDRAADMWPALAARTLTVTKGWSEGYGLFLKGEAPMVLSYTTSPAYHRMMESTDRYKATLFPEGHVIQIEVAGRIATSDQPELAARFLAFLVSRAAQEKIPTTNWMYPVIDLGDALPREFRDLPKPAKTLALTDEEISAHRKQWIDEWLGAVAP
jgi:thiamine transport system substrate-binding protein